MKKITNQQQAYRRYICMFFVISFNKTVHVEYTNSNWCFCALFAFISNFVYSFHQIYYESKATLNTVPLYAVQWALLIICVRMWCSVFGLPDKYNTFMPEECIRFRDLNFKEKYENCLAQHWKWANNYVCEF